MKNSVLKNCIVWLTTIALICAVWIVAHKIVGNELILPDFFESVKGIGGLFSSATFWRAFGGTLLRVLRAFFISFIFAVITAVIAYLLPAFSKIFAPITAIFRSVPTLAILLIVLLATNADGAPVVVAFFTLFPTLYAGVYAALCQVDSGLVEMSKVYNVPLYKRVFSLYVPCTLPYVARVSAGALSLALKLVASAEVLASTFQSVGGMMQDAKNALDTPLLFALLIVTVCLGLVLEGLGALIAYFVERGRK